MVLTGTGKAPQSLLRTLRCCSDVLAAFGYAATAASSHAYNPEVFDITVEWLFTVAVAITVATNTLCTGRATCQTYEDVNDIPFLGLIAYKIYMSLRLIKMLGYSRVTSSGPGVALIIFLESAAIYLIAIIALAVLAAMKLNAQFILLFMVSSLLWLSLVDASSHVKPGALPSRYHFCSHHHSSLSRTE
jgi:hypothetical protein